MSHTGALVCVVGRRTQRADAKPLDTVRENPQNLYFLRVS